MTEVKEKVVYEKSTALTDVPLHFCPGCTHGIVHKLVAECLVELGVDGKTVGVAPVGCAAPSTAYWNVDMTLADHGRAPALATGIKRVEPDKFVFTYQGDGDLASIGTNEIVQAAHRGENISVVFINNAIYGMTGGQMAPTTLVGQVTTTSPKGRDEAWSGKPLKVAEMLATIDGAKFVERVAVNSPGNIRKAKAAIKKCFEYQIDGKGFGIVEVLSTCSTNWGMTPVDAMKWVDDNMIPYYPLGRIKEE